MSTAARVRWYPQRKPFDVGYESQAGGRPSRHDAERAPLRFDPLDFEPLLATRLLVLQPTPFCNIACDYCYLPRRDSTERMSIATVRRAAERLRDDGLAGRELSVVWHAGEPLVAPVSFYEDAIGALEQVLGPRTALSHSLQTNATLIDAQWCALFARHSIRVGVSVDGPAFLHDAHRRTRAARGTHARVVAGMRVLRDHGIDFHAIAVVTAETLQRADAFIEFFLREGVAEVGCNFDEAEGVHGTSSLAGREAAHAAFIERLLERSNTAGRSVRIRELTSAFRLIAEGLPKSRWRGRSRPDNAQTLPFAIVSIAANGDFTTFSPELLGQTAPAYGDFTLGNVAASGFLESARSERFLRLWAAIEDGVAACERSCAHYDFCGGGAPVNKWYENGDLASAETLYCRTMTKRPFDAVLARLERDARLRTTR